jgi:hypothetical protein
MIAILTIGLTASLIMILFMAYKINEIDKFLPKSPEKIKEGDIVLKKLKEMPDISDIDPNHQLIKDVIETAKYENWEAKIEEEYSTVGKSWRFQITNPTKTLTISCILRTYEKETKVGYFNVMGGSGGVSYGGLLKKDTMVEYLVIEYLWSLIVDKNEKDCQETTQNYLTAKSLIEKELKSLRRNKQLENLFGDNLEV